MDVSRDVVLDLLPVYLADEASAATRLLVEEFAKRDAEIAERIRIERRALVEGLPTAAVPAHLEVITLTHVRRLLRLQRWLFGFALAFAAFGCSFEYTLWGGRLHEAHMMVRDYPVTFGGALVASGVCWMAYFIVRRRIEGAGF